jgi:hypothetical protein
MSEELLAYTNDNVSDLMISWPSFQIQRSKHAQSLGKDEIGVNKLDSGLYVFLGLSSSLFSFCAFR